MKLHIKLVLSLLSGLVVVVVLAQALQYFQIAELVTNLSKSNLQLIRDREREFAINIYQTVERAISGSLERGEMEKFVALLRSQREIEGLLGFTLYDRHGKVFHSVGSALAEKELPEEIRTRLMNDPEIFVSQTQGATEIYKAQMINNDCIRCHADWEVGKAGGINHLKFSTEALARSESLAAAVISDMKRSAVISSCFSVAGIILVLFVTMYLLVKHLVSYPLQNTVDMLQDIAEGEGDLTRRLEINSQDEVGELAKWFNSFMDKLQRMVGIVAGDVSDVNASSTQLTMISDDMTAKADQMRIRSGNAANATEQTAINIKSIAVAAEQVSVQVASVASASEKVSHKMSEIRSATENVSDNVNVVAAATEQISGSVNTVAISMEEMYASLNEVAKNSGRGAHVTNEASEKADQTSGIVNVLGEAANEIGDVVDLIMGIASRTNLLALNATIEAAGAGEAGKGFAVVANEVKELARQTGRASEVIRDKVKSMQKNTGAAINAIEVIVAVINEINAIMSTIASAVEEQTASTNEISKSISETASTANSVSNNVQEAAQRAAETSKNVQEAVQLELEVSLTLEEVAQAAVAIARDAVEASEGTDTVLENVAGVNEAAKVTSQGAARTKVQADELAALAGQLQKIVGHFKISAETGAEYAADAGSAAAGADFRREVQPQTQAEKIAILVRQLQKIIGNTK